MPYIQVKFWDLRHFSKSVKILEGHTQGVACIQYNQFHDQLLLRYSGLQTYTYTTYIYMRVLSLILYIFVYTVYAYMCK